MTAPGACKEDPVSGYYSHQLMATVTHYIYSYYDAKDREALEIATGQTSSHQHTEVEDDSADPWQTESSFGARRRLANAPRFVPAVFSYDEVNNMMGIPKHLLTPPTREEPKSEVSAWYRSLTSSRSSPGSELESNSAAPPPRASTAPAEHSPLLIDSTSQPTSQPAEPAAKPRIRPDKNNWFITRALRSEPSSKPATPAPTLADILAREPPALSSQQAVKPPVFLALGPSNRGWSMLQQQGWNEGEGLGANAPRRQPKPSIAATTSTRSRAKGKEVDRGLVKQEELEVQLDLDGEISEVRKVEVVDLTLSDSDDDNEAYEKLDTERSPSSEPQQPVTSTEPLEAHSKPILTPIPTILKSDRLGIGLKAKTVGPYKASKKRVTHNQAALAAHTKEAEELRRLKALVGRGSRGFSRLAKADSEHRRQLLANLNSP